MSTAEKKSTAKKTGLMEFMRETQIEIGKVTWPSRKETMMTTVMIIVMAIVTGIFFLGVDSLLGYLITHLLGMKS